MVFVVSARYTPIKPSCISDSDHYRIKSLKNKCKPIEDKLEKNITLALKKCNPSKNIMDPENAQCAVLWDEIEELSNAIHNMRNEINCLVSLKTIEDNNDDDDCWDSIECKMYDI